MARGPTALETMTLTTSGSGMAIDENIDISANGERATFSRDAANIARDLNEVERIEFVAGAGADSVTISDLTSWISAKSTSIARQWPSAASATAPSTWWQMIGTAPG